MNVVVLISGNGSNLQAILNAMQVGADTNNNTENGSQQKKLPIKLTAVISSNPHAHGLERAKKANIHTEVLDHHKFNNRQSFDDALQQLVDRFNPQLLVLAGFMRILTDRFIEHYMGRIINIHPSLLPQFPGLNTHQQALDAGVKTHGATVHFVIPELDAGPVITQAQVPVLENDTAELLKTRVLEQEHAIYPLAIRWFAENRLTLKNNIAYLDGCELAP